ncbi:MAG TPA: hypothetical protein VF939_07665 [Puia sp.]
MVLALLVVFAQLNKASYLCSNTQSRPALFLEAYYPLSIYH